MSNHAAARSLGDAKGRDAWSLRRALAARDRGSAPDLHLALAGRAENVALVRHVIGGLAETIPLGAALEDVRGAVSEAANNVAVHAYEGQEGPMEIDARLLGEELELRVRDRGIGFAAAADGAIESREAPATSCGIGLDVIAALSSRCEIRSQPGRGSEISMRFPLARGTLRGGGGAAAGGGSGRSIQRLGAESDVEIAIAPAEIRRPLLGRLVGALAARASFSLDRLSDAQLLSDALVARVVAPLSGRYLRVGVASQPRKLTLRVGGLRAGACDRLAAESAPGSLAQLSARLGTELECASSETADMLTLVMRDGRRRRRATPA